MVFMVFVLPLTQNPPSILTICPKHAELAILEQEKILLKGKFT
jgi:hypothetical protein